jgi:3-dehydroquinate synthase
VNPNPVNPSPVKVESVSVALGARSYDILVGDTVLSNAGQWIAPHLARPRTVIVTDETVAKLHLETLQAALTRAGIASQAIVLAPGEATKSFAQLESLVERLLELEVERRDVVVAFGGGVIGDLAGFAASILRRGVDFIQIPTTLLAQVDSSIGGKTAINSPHGKNLIGAFHQPKLVLADVGLLESLPRRERCAGYAEVVKLGLIGDAAFFAWLEDHGQKVIEGDSQSQIEAVVKSCRHKARIVAEDEFEQGNRALLNLGHTFGHALEAETGYSGALLHGEAVAIGLSLAFELSAMLGYCPGEAAGRVRLHLAAVGLPAGLASFGGENTTPDALLAHMRQDKKVQNGKLTFVLARGVGQAFISSDVPESAVMALLTRELAPA